MDKKTQKLIDQYSLSEEILNSEELTIEMDLSGLSPLMLEQIKTLGLQMVENPTKQLSGGEIFNLMGSASSIMAFMDLLAKNFGDNAQVGIFVVALGSFAALSIKPARELILKQIAEKRGEKN